MKGDKLFVACHGQRTVDTQEAYERQRISTIELSGGHVINIVLVGKPPFVQIPDAWISGFKLSHDPGFVELTDEGLIEVEHMGKFLSQQDIRLIRVGSAPKFSQTLDVMKHYFNEVPIDEDILFGTNVSWVRIGKKLVAIDGAGHIIPNYVEVRLPPEDYWKKVEFWFTRAEGSKFICGGAQVLRRLLGKGVQGGYCMPV